MLTFLLRILFTVIFMVLHQSASDGEPNTSHQSENVIESRKTQKVDSQSNGNYVAC